MESVAPMNRLVQGDVGSGKTAVAMAAVYKAWQNGYQSVMMAPTEILAGQHFSEFNSVFGDANGTSMGTALGTAIPRIELLTASRTASERQDLLDRLGRGEIDILIGTHALIQPDVAFHRLGLVITDEHAREFAVVLERGAGDARRVEAAWLDSNLERPRGSAGPSFGISLNFRLECVRWGGP
jgi:ATP-dependent DNA helicase RecG